MNNDLISREALRKDIEHLHSVYAKNKEWFYTDVLDHIDNAPTVCNDNYAMGYQDGVKKVLSERPQGEWIEQQFGTTLCRFSYFTCNNCGISTAVKTNFCPSCGADMREVTKND